KYIVVSVNPKIYPLSVIYSAAYVFLEKAYVILDGNPDEEILVELRYMEENKDIEKLGRDFNNELINYAVFQYNSEQSKTVKEEIIKKALSTNIVQSPEILNQECEEEDYKEEDYKEDSLGIAVPWDEKYGDKKND
ncbi:hypothetical protein HN451_01075, partial [archaeon]|nr:hypothetical protein [archaeon]